MFTKEYFIKLLKAGAVRTVKTMAETALAIIGTNTFGITDVDWLGVLSACALSGVITILSCLRGLPETDYELELETAYSGIYDSEGE
jgi:hypothetical protein